MVTGGLGRAHAAKEPAVAVDIRHVLHAAIVDCEVGVLASPRPPLAVSVRSRLLEGSGVTSADAILSIDILIAGSHGSGMSIARSLGTSQASFGATH